MDQDSCDGSLHIKWQFPLRLPRASYFFLLFYFDCYPGPTWTPLIARKVKRLGIMMSDDTRNENRRISSCPIRVVRREHYRNHGVLTSTHTVVTTPTYDGDDQ